MPDKPRTRRFEITDRVTRYKNRWLRVVEYSTKTDGRVGIYGVVERSNAVAILARATDDRVLLLQQFRYPTEGYAWELPMGAIDHREAPGEAARRELREETGLKVDVELLGSFHPIPGLTPQIAYAFSASVPPAAIRDADEPRADKDEIVGRCWVPRAEIPAMIRRGEITDGFTLCTFALCWPQALVETER